MSKSISDAVREIVARKPYLLEYLSSGIVNTRALAREISGEVKEEIGREVKIQSIVTALRRIPRKKIKKTKISEILAKSKVNLKYDAALLTLKLTKENLEKIADIKERKNFIILQGIETITIIGDEKAIEKIKDFFNELEFKRNLAFVIVESPKEITTTPGVIARIASILAAEKINIEELLSTHAETCIVLKEENALKAVEAIRREIKFARKRSYLNSAVS